VFTANLACMANAALALLPGLLRRLLLVLSPFDLDTINAARIRYGAW
jgi:hypothetical protein